MLHFVFIFACFSMCGWVWVLCALFLDMWILLLLFLLVVPSHLSFHSRFMRTEETTKTNIILLVLCEMWIRMTDMKFRQRLLGFFVFSRRFLKQSHNSTNKLCIFYKQNFNNFQCNMAKGREKNTTISVCALCTKGKHPKKERTSIQKTFDGMLNS